MSSEPNPIAYALGERDVVFLTGATGFLGAGLARALGERRVSVHALVRPATDGSALAETGCVVHAGDLTNPATVLAATASSAGAARERGGRFFVLHAGALISYLTRDAELAWRINVEGTRHVLAAARHERAARLLFVSSVVAVGCAEDGRPIDERAAFNLGHLGVHYTDTKRAAEELVLAARDDLDVVVVNPGAIFGPADRKSNTLLFLREMAEGRGPIVAPPGSISVVGLDDTVTGTVQALERGRRGERYILVESFVKTRALFACIAEEVGGRPARATVPRWLLSACVPLVALWDRFFPVELASPQALRMLGCDLCLDASKARRELGWSPQPFRAVLHATVAELRRRGRLPERRPDG